jgi:hypothetical protein
LRGLLLTLGAALVAGFTSQGDGPIVIADVTVVDVNAGVSRPHQSVVVRDSLIEAVVPADAVKPPAGRIVDGAGKFLIPGLWDTHVHLNGDGEVLRVFLAAGITGVRDMGGDFAPLAEARRLIDSGQWQGPRLVLSGPMIRGPQRESDKSGRGSRVVRTPEEGRQAVNELVKLGVDFIKIQDFPIPRDVSRDCGGRSSACDSARRTCAARGLAGRGVGVGPDEHHAFRRAVSEGVRAAVQG